MKLKAMAVTYGRKLNLGDYCSVHAEVSLWADLDEDEDEAEAMGDLWTMAKNNVKNVLAVHEPKVVVKEIEKFLGKPVNNPLTVEAAAEATVAAILGAGDAD